MKVAVAVAVQSLFGLSGDWTRQDRGNGSARPERLDKMQGGATSAAAWFAGNMQFMPQVTPCSLSCSFYACCPVMLNEVVLRIASMHALP